MTTKKNATAKTAKVSNFKKVTEKTTCKVRVDFLAKLIAENKFTQKQLSAIVNEVFVAHTKAANNTILVDAKNVLYNQFAKLVITDKVTSVMSFANYSDKKIAEMRKAAQSEKESKKAASVASEKKEAKKVS